MVLVGPQLNSFLSQSEPHYLLLIVLKDVQFSRQENSMNFNTLGPVVLGLA